MTTMMRDPDWPERLHELFQARGDAPFAWGQTDCVCLAAAAVQALTRRDVLGASAQWSSARQALEAIRGWTADGSLEAAVSAELGPCVANPLAACRGDILLIDAQHVGQQHVELFPNLLAVCDGAQWVAPGPNGLVTGRGGVLAVWPIGRGETNA